MNPLLEAAYEVAGVCRERSLRYCFIGGFAVLRWGEPRLTREVDLTVIDALLDGLAARVEQARAFALRHRTLLLQASNGTPLNVALGALPCEERAAERATPWQVTPSVALVTCSAEDLVVHKVFAGRDRDWLDVEGIVARQGNRLDRGLIDGELGPLLELKEAAADLDRLHAILDHDRP